MRLVTISLIALALTACGPSQEEIDNTAIITCNIMGESRNMDGAMRIREINAARKKIGAAPYLGTDLTIIESLEWGLCEDLVKDETVYQSELAALKQVAELARLEKERREKPMKDAMTLGSDVYRQRCVMCHGSKGEGAGFLGPAILASKIVMDSDQTNHADIIWNGRASTNMPAFKDNLTFAELASVMTYSMNSFGNDSGVLVQPADLQFLTKD